MVQAALRRLVTDERWPRFAAAARETGLRSKNAAILFGKPPRLVRRRFAIGGDGAQPLEEIRALEGLADEPPELLLGPGAEAGAEAIASAGAACVVEPGFETIDVAVIARLTAVRDPAVGPPAPIYLRAPDAEPSKEPRPARLGVRGAG